MRTPTQEEFALELRRRCKEASEWSTPDQLDALRHDVLLLQHGQRAMKRTLEALLRALERAELPHPKPEPIPENPFDDPPPEAA
jgi:hypothetical protein